MHVFLGPLSLSNDPCTSLFAVLLLVCIVLPIRYRNGPAYFVSAIAFLLWMFLGLIGRGIDA